MTILLEDVYTVPVPESGQSNLFFNFQTASYVWSYRILSFKKSPWVSPHMSYWDPKKLRVQQTANWNKRDTAGNPGYCLQRSAYELMESGIKSRVRLGVVTCICHRGSSFISN